MAANPLLPAVDVPHDIVTAIARDAARDAERVGLFLTQLGLKTTPEKPLALPAGFLCHLGAALRLLEWEGQGFFFHIDAGVPKAQQAIHEAFLSFTESDADPIKLCTAVLRLSVERFSWSGPPELGADIALDEVQEDVLLEALADFLWEHRPG
jgi:hypothetical protein